MSEDLKETIKRLIDLHGRSASRIAEELNLQGITTPTGKVWTRKNVSTYISRNLKSYEPRHPTGATAEVSTGVPGDSTGVPGDSVEVPKDRTLESLEDLHWKDVLQDMAVWWEQNRGAVIRVASAPPAFKKPRKNSGIHCSEEILKRAMKQAKLEKDKTGGSLSRLVELLLWKYLGEPEDVLE